MDKELQKLERSMTCSTSTEADQKAISTELLACLTLVVPSSMSAEDRMAWISVARETLAGLTIAELREGGKRARENCRFPSEIVPTILGNVEEKQTSGFISESGYIYRGSLEDVLRQAEHRADWNTYWAAKRKLRSGLPAPSQATN